MAVTYLSPIEGSCARRVLPFEHCHFGRGPRDLPACIARRPLRRKVERHADLYLPELRCDIADRAGAAGGTEAEMSEVQRRSGPGGARGRRARRSGGRRQSRQQRSPRQAGRAAPTGAAQCGHAARDEQQTASNDTATVRDRRQTASHRPHTTRDRAAPCTSRAARQAAVCTRRDGETTVRTRCDVQATVCTTVRTRCDTQATVCTTVRTRCDAQATVYTTNRTRCDGQATILTRRAGETTVCTGCGTEAPGKSSRTSRAAQAARCTALEQCPCQAGGRSAIGPRHGPQARRGAAAFTGSQQTGGNGSIRSGDCEQAGSAGTLGAGNRSKASSNASFVFRSYQQTGASSSPSSQ
jgi:hypothetical protein